MVTGSECFTRGQVYNSKHAFLIMAHKHDLVLKTLIQMIDDPRNDIYIHMDVKNSDYDEKSILDLVSRSKIYHTKRTNVSWGSYSQINAELVLLQMATGLGCYQYYHLISGADLLIQTQDIFHDFFDKNAGKEFISFDGPGFKCDDRIRLYHLFQEKIGRSSDRSLIVRGANFLFLRMQKLLHINNKNTRNISFRKGSNWFSITDGLARFVLSKKQWIQDIFKYTFCADEIFLHTIVSNSDFKNKLYHSGGKGGNPSMRFIDWDRGTPYVFKSSDCADLLSSDMMFARKFDPHVDEEIIRVLKNVYQDDKKEMSNPPVIG